MARRTTDSLRGDDMGNKDEEFYCKGSQLASYLVSRGCNLLRVDDGVFVFEYHKSIDAALRQWEIDFKKCMF